MKANQIPQLIQAVLNGADDAPIELALKLLKEHEPDLQEALWRAPGFDDPAACAWIAEWLPDDYQPPTSDHDDESDEYDTAPDAGGSELAEGLLYERGSAADSAFVIKTRARPKGRRRVTRSAVLIQGGPRSGRYTPIHNDETAIREFLTREGICLNEWQRAIAPHRHRPWVTMGIRTALQAKINELLDMRAHEQAIAGVLGCHRETVMILAGRAGSCPQRAQRAA